MPSRQVKSSYIAYLCLAVLFLFAVVVRIRTSLDTFIVLSHPEKAGTPVDLDDPSEKIIAVSPEAEAAGIHVGNLLRQVNGKSYSGMSDIYVPVWFGKAGDHMRLQVERRDTASPALIDAEVPLPKANMKALTVQDWILGIFIGILMP